MKHIQKISTELGTLLNSDDNDIELYSILWKS